MSSAKSRLLQDIAGFPLQDLYFLMLKDELNAKVVVLNTSGYIFNTV